MVVLGEKDAILVVFKWTRITAGIDILVDLERKSGLVRPVLGDQQIRFALCSRSGFTPQLIEDPKRRRDVTLFDLSENVGEK